MARPFAYAAFAAALVVAPAAFAASTNPADMPAGEYVLDKTHASVVATVGHQGFSNYTFRFDKFDATYTYDPAKPEAAALTVTIDANSMNTGWDVADKQFPAEFIAADKHPTVTFKSTAIKRGADNKGTVTGDLTLAGVTKPVTLNVVFNGSGKDMMGKIRSGFSATTTLDRTQFGSTKYAPMIGKDVALAIEVEFTKK